VRLPDGARVILRPLGPEDRQLLVEGFARLSESSRYRRFFTVMRELDDTMLSYLTEIDHHDHEALIALEGETGAGIGIARYVRSEPGSEVAEFAVAVIDARQRRGVGRALLRRLATRARQEGVRIVTATVKAETRRRSSCSAVWGRPRRCGRAASSICASRCQSAAPEQGSAARSARSQSERSSRRRPRRPRPALVGG
jgi:GNAT superfamily N-acetyltransferase